MCHPNETSASHSMSTSSAAAAMTTARRLVARQTATYGELKKRYACTSSDHWLDVVNWLRRRSQSSSPSPSRSRALSLLFLHLALRVTVGASGVSTPPFAPITASEERTCRVVVRPHHRCRVNVGHGFMAEGLPTVKPARSVYWPSIWCDRAWHPPPLLTTAHHCPPYERSPEHHGPGPTEAEPSMSPAISLTFGHGAHPTVRCLRN